MSRLVCWVRGHRPEMWRYTGGGLPIEICVRCNRVLRRFGE